MVELAVLLALISLFFAGLNDFVFKVQAGGSQRCGQYLAVVGGVWMLVFLIVSVVQGAFYISPVAVKWGVIVGLVSAVANYLLIVSLRHLDASVGATIYRLNLLIATIIAIVFLGENLTLSKAVGVVAASIAVILFSATNKKDRTESLKWALVCVFTASLLRAIVGIGYKLFALEAERLPSNLLHGQSEYFLATQGLLWLVVGLVVMRLEGDKTADRKAIKIGLISGLLISGIVWFFNRAMALGDASVIIPISQMSFLVTALLSRVFVKEKFVGLKPVAIAVSVAAIFLLSKT